MVPAKARQLGERELQRWADRDLCTGMRRFIAEVEQVYDGLPDDRPIEEQRRTYDELARRYTRQRPAGVRTRDQFLPAANGHSVRVRIYEPVDRPDGDSPALIFFHGGGFALGSIDSHDCVVAELALASSAIAISVDYRLAPEHPFPAAFEDAVGVWLHVSGNAAQFGIDKTRIIVAGDSAGAALAIAVCQEARRAQMHMPAGQLLIYPALTAAADLPSYRENAIAPMLTASSLAYFWSLYTNGGETARDPRAAPLEAVDFSGLPPACIATAQHDPCRDDGFAYAQKLGTSGIPVDYRCAPKLAHGYLRARALSPAAAAEFAALSEGARALLRTARISSNSRDAA